MRLRCICFDQPLRARASRCEEIGGGEADREAGEQLVRERAGFVGLALIREGMSELGACRKVMSAFDRLQTLNEGPLTDSMRKAHSAARAARSVAHQHSSRPCFRVR